MVLASPSPSWHVSSSLEKVLEHRLVAGLATSLWLSGTTEIEILRSEVDAHGYDIVIEARGTIRHIQLKAMVKGGKRREVGVNLRLASKPSGCVIWMIYDPATLELGPFLWLGGGPGQPLPDLGSRVVKHSKANAEGVKLERTGHRLLPKSRFQTLPTIGDLAEALFGKITKDHLQHHESDHMTLLKGHLEARPPSSESEWLRRVRGGDFSAVPEDLNWENSVELAHLIDGYELVAKAGLGDPFQWEEHRLASAQMSGRWGGTPLELWVTLFLEHRRWRMAPMDPDITMRGFLDALCEELRLSLQKRATIESA